MDSPKTYESTAVSSDGASAIQSYAVKRAPEIERGGRIPPQAYEASSEKQVTVYPDYPEVVEAAPPAWTDATHQHHQPHHGPAELGTPDKVSNRDEWSAAALASPHQQHQHEPKQQPYEESVQPAPPPKDGRRLLKRRAFWAVAAVIVVVIVALAVGLGVGLGTRHTENAAPASATASAVPETPTTAAAAVCRQGIRYCGWDLIQSRNYTIVYLEDAGSTDVYNDLFLCADNNGVTFNATCGGAHHCQPPEYDRNGCSVAENQSCCGTVS